ncbi:hypothetical protein X943_001595 [Babesia divergens]|uniref:rRNA biogenesis protein RRP36 n=1 Tax=Babesia divergens TaxID=32595 RepID=A0AAD9LE45_BABDI|nr:hypothetical protein X943_001595 [Babesia divergens]
MTELTLGELKALRERESSSAALSNDAQNDDAPQRGKVKEPSHNKNHAVSSQTVIKKRGSKAPVMLPNNVTCNPYTIIKLGKKGPDARLVPRDPRFSDFSGTLNDDMFRKSYAFLDEMRQDEAQEIKAALRLHERAGPNSMRAATALENLRHMGISSIDDAKRALDKYKIQNQQLQSDESLRQFKKQLIEEEKEKIAHTGKTPFYYSQKKVKKIYRDREQVKVKAVLESAAINSAAAAKIHKKAARQNKRQLKRQPQLGVK